MNLRASAVLLTVAAAVAVTGCESVSSRVSGRFATVPPKLRTFDAGNTDIFHAAQYVLRQMDYTLTRTAIAQGIVNAKSRVIPADSLGGARQFTIDLTLSGPAAGPTEVAMLLRQGVEGDFRAGPQQETLRDHGLYAAFFAALDKALKTQPPPWLTPAGR
ncbi:MAG: hypothetical protein JNL39_13735 [Opitutaceae bacterium]|nr:hypothetical protein [Opitutaceae bacterium]